MDELPIFHYNAIHADPPWNFSAYSEKGQEKSAQRHYDCMSLHDIKALPVGSAASKDCVLFLWVTDPMLQEGLEVMKAWGFQYKTVAFTWVKLNKKYSKWLPLVQNDFVVAELARLFFMGAGYWTRANPEMCLMGVVGSPERLSRGVRQLIFEPLREHSRKPESVYTRIPELVNGPYLDLFSREKRPGWDNYGLEADKFNE